MTDSADVSHEEEGRRKQQLNDARALELFEMERQFNTAHRRLLAQTLLGCLGCCGAGLFLISWAVHTTDATLGGIAFWSGLLVGDVGMVALLLRHYHCADDVGP